MEFVGCSWQRASLDGSGSGEASPPQLFYVQEYCECRSAARRCRAGRWRTGVGPETRADVAAAAMQVRQAHARPAPRLRMLGVLRSRRGHAALTLCSPHAIRSGPAGAGGSLGDLVRRQMASPFKKMYSDADALRW